MSIERSYTDGARNGKIIAGLILLIVGGVLLLEQMNWFFFPSWLISWPMFLIALGLYIGAKNNFRKPIAPVVLIFIGLINLSDDIIPGLDLSRLFWPILIIGFGLWMIVGRNRQWNHLGKAKYRDQNFFSANTSFDNPFNPKPAPDPNYDPNAPAADQPYSTNVPPYMGDDVIDSVSIFGGHKRTVLSKTFKGGEIINIFGGTDLDMTQADINGRVVIEIVQLFGGIKLIIPPHWQVTSDVASVFANIDDKRRSMGTPLSPDKVLVITGVSIFAGVDIRSF